MTRRSTDAHARRGRPPITDGSRLDHRLQLRLSAAEHHAIEALAQAERRSMARVVVERAVAEAIRRGLVAPES